MSIKKRYVFFFKESSKKHIAKKSYTPPKIVIEFPYNFDQLSNRKNYHQISSEVKIPGTYNLIRLNTEIIERTLPEININSGKCGTIKNDLISVSFYLPEEDIFLKAEAVKIYRTKSKIGLKTRCTPEENKRIIKTLTAYTKLFDIPKTEEHLKPAKNVISQNHTVFLNDSSIPLIAKNISTSDINTDTLNKAAHEGIEVEVLLDFNLTKQSIDKKILCKKSGSIKTQYYPLTHPQQRIWYSEKLYPNNFSGNLFHSCKFNKQINFKKLKELLNTLVKNQQSLRIRVKNLDGKPYQYVSSFTPFKIDFYDFNTPENTPLFNKFIEKKISTSIFKFDADLFFFTLLIFPDGKQGFLFGVHHTIMDETSIALMIKEIKNLYNKNNDDKKNFFNKMSYIDYIQHERNYKNSSQFQKDKIFWKNKLKDFSSPALVKEQNQTDDITAERKTFQLSKNLKKRIEKFCSKKKISVFRLFLAGLYTYINRLTNKTDICIGSIFHNRFNKKLKNLMGMLVSTVPIRIKPEDNDWNFNNLLNKIKKQIHQIKEHQEFPYDLLIPLLKQQGFEQPLFDIVLNYHNMDFSLATEWHFHKAQTFPLMINLSHRANNKTLQIEIDYQTKLFTNNEIDRLYDHLMNIITSAIDNEYQAIKNLEMLSLMEKENNILGFNNTAANYPKNKTLHQFFEEKVKKNPECPAISFRGETLTYGQLNSKANQLAVVLQKKGVKPDTIVALSLYRSFEMLIGILGILKAGGAYLPIDPDYPNERKTYLLEDSGAKLLLTTSQLTDSIPWNGEIINIENKDLYKTKECKPFNSAAPNNLAYIIYTSGSTGKPKGVMIEHHSVFNILWDLQQRYPLKANDTYLLKTTFTFDVSVAEIFGWFFGEGKLEILEPGDEKEPKKILNSIYEHKITHLNFVPSMFKLFLYALNNEDITKLNSLKYIFAAGEAITPNIIKSFNKLQTSIALENIYGPTESTIYATAYSLKNNNNTKNIPIGKPMANIQCYILDKEKRVTPVGIPGELYIGGAGLARGYLNRKELTNERFVENPFRPGEKIYKTGDLVKWLPDGNIEYRGRIDFQVKIRGYRIELGEIESFIRKFPEVNDVVVLAAKGNLQIAAYIVEAKESSVNFFDIKKELKKLLPDYMVPDLYTTIEKIPLNQSGKVDRHALESIKIMPVLNRTIKTPTSPIEAQIFELWKKVLQIDSIDINSNFYDAGGNSLKLIELSVGLNKLFKSDISVIELFKHSTIKLQAEYMAAQNDNKHETTGNTISCSEKDEKDLTTDIAVIGMSCKFPGASNPQDFWNNLKKGKESITFFTDQELIDAGVDKEILKQPSYVKAKGVINDIEYFDADFFGYSKRDASYMDPQVRIFHETVYKALESSGYNSESYNGKIGLFAGSGDNFYWLNKTLGNKKNYAERFPLMILNKDFLCTRIAYKLGLKGPAVTIQTACSTSLVAVDMAVKSLLRGDCDIALAGGVSLFLPQKEGYLYKEGFTFSPDGHCKAFDAKAKGLVWGEGSGAVVLKPLKQAIKDKDNVWAIIKGSASNNDGSFKIGYTAPGIDGQSSVIREAYDKAAVSPETISYIEAHGTATPLGDPIEIEGLKTAFKTDQKQFCKIGSVKTNIGHLDAAAGIAGFIKTVLSLHHKMLPPTLHYESPNPEINFPQTPFQVNDKLINWNKKANLPRRAGVSSFGIGGTNAHVIIEETPSSLIKRYNNENEFKLILLSAKTEKTLKQMSKKLIHFFKNHPEVDLKKSAYTLQVGRQFFNHRRMILCKSLNEAITLLSSKEQMDYYYSNNSQPEKIVGDNERVKEIITEIKKKQKNNYDLLHELGQIWCKGAEVNWEDIYNGRVPGRVHLPGYSFDRKRYWPQELDIEYIIPSKESFKSQERVSTKENPIQKEEKNIIEKISLIWKKNFMEKHIDTEEDFYELGGDSLLAVQITDEINTRFNLDIPSSFLSNHSTIKEMAEIIEEKIAVKSLKTISKENTPTQKNTINIEKEISLIWKKNFMEEHIDIEEDFYELGGDSLLAVQITDEINTRFNLDIPSSYLSNHSTIKEMTDIIEKKITVNNKPEKIAHYEDSQWMVNLKKGNSDKILFLIHPVAGTVSFYRELCKSLQSDITVYGIQDPRIDAKDALFLSIEQLADTYIKAIRKIQPEGPYFLGGSSFGGSVAFEIASRLEEQNLEVKTLFLIDTPGPKELIPKFQEDTEVMAYFLSYNNLDYYNTLTHLKTLNEHKRLEFFLSKNSIYQKTLLDNNRLETLRKSINLTMLNSKAMEQYCIKTSKHFNGRTVFFSAMIPSRIPVFLEKSWEGFCLGDFETHQIPGNHITINTSNNVKTIGEKINYNLRL